MTRLPKTQKMRIEKLACEFFAIGKADFTLGKNGASLYISNPPLPGHYISAKDAARFYSFALDMIGLRSLNINPEFLSELLY